MKLFEPIENISPEKLLESISKFQSEGNKLFAGGIFPSSRFHSYLPYSFPDDNIFFTASITYILQQYKKFFESDHQNLIEEISSKAVSNYNFYKNNQDLKLYNFWRTNPEDNYRPNEWILKNNRNKKWARKLFRLAEDIDDTALVYLTSSVNKSDLKELQECLIYNANLSRRKIKNTMQQYRDFKAYSTWFGSIKAAIEFDICAMSNMLLVTLDNGLELSQQDLETLELLKHIIENSDYFEYTHVLSPFYLRASTILYHLSRLLSKKENHFSKMHKEKLVKDLKSLSHKTKSKMELILLSSSLMKLGEKQVEIDIQKLTTKEINNFWFCAENIASIENRISFSLGSFPFFHIKFKSVPHTLSLLLEHEILKKVKK